MNNRFRVFCAGVIAVFLLTITPSFIDIGYASNPSLDQLMGAATVVTEPPKIEPVSEEKVAIKFKRIQDFIENKDPDKKLQTIRNKIIYGLSLTLLFILVWKLINLVYQKSLKKLKSLNWDNYSLKVQHLELISPERVSGLAALSVKGIRITLDLCILYLYITLLLNLFPWTQQIGENLVSHVVNSIRDIVFSFLSYVPSLIILVLIIAGTYYASRLIKQVLTEVEKGHLSFPGFYPEWAMPTYKLSLVLLIIFAATVAYPYLPGGFESPAFRGIAIFGAVLGALGARESVSDIISGIVLIYSRSFLEGDRIIVNDIKGTVLEKTLLVTRIKTPKNVVVTIPNSSLRSSHIINFSSAMREVEAPLVLHASITLGYDLPWRKVHEVLEKAALMTPNVLDQPAPFVLQTSMNDYHITYELNAYTDKPTVMERTYSSLYQNIQDQCKEADIEILSPTYFAVRDGNEITIPPKVHL